MKYMLVFLLACAVVGLWSPARARHGKLILVLTVVLVVYFFLFPNNM